MRIRQEHLDGLFGSRVEQEPILHGQKCFVKHVGRAFLAHVDIHESKHQTNFPSIVIDVHSNMKLKEVVYCQQDGVWDFLNPYTGEDIETVGMDEALKELRLQNPKGPQLEELNLYLGDCTIVIKRLYKNSIEEMLSRIFNNLAEHYAHLTQEHRIAPYEIFVPVFAEGLPDKCLEEKHGKPHYCGCDYSRYWGLYFEDKNDAVIYDLSKKSFISGDLYMLDH